MMADGSFRLLESTIQDIHKAFRAKELTARQLVELYLARNDACNENGPAINAVVAVNPRAVAQAEELDQSFANSGQLTGPLHGVPVLVKDQIETSGIPTTFGSIAIERYIPDNDATLIRQLKQAGAIILGKTLLPDFATSWFALSSAGGEAKNPYALDRDTGGSSSGTGAAIAANLGAVGIGEDTGGSIRVPSSFNNLVGFRVTTGLISRNGMSPLVVFQDTAGPMARTVHDTALLLDALIGYDPSDPFTAVAVNARPNGGYASQLPTDGLQGARIGVLRGAFGSNDETDSAAVNQVMDKAICDLANAGAQIVDPVTLPGLMDFIVTTSLYIAQSKHDITEFLQARPQLPVHSLQEVYDSKQYHPGLDLIEAIAGGPENPEDDPNYYKGLAARQTFQRAILNIMASHNLDVIIYPTVQVPPPTKADVHSLRWTTLTFPTNTLIASQADLPAMSIPAGFTENGVPVGMEVVGKPYDERTLLRLGYAYEQATHHRRAPQSAPKLANEP
jgi:amidase